MYAAQTMRRRVHLSLVVPCVANDGARPVHLHRPQLRDLRQRPLTNSPVARPYPRLIELSRNLAHRPPCRYQPITFSSHGCVSVSGTSFVSLPSSTRPTWPEVQVASPKKSVSALLCAIVVEGYRGKRAKLFRRPAKCVRAAQILATANSAAST